MTDKELRKMSRSELLELLIEQTEENESLKEQLNKANEQLKKKAIIIENSGSIAEAALQLNGVFEAAQNAAQQYLDNIKQQWKRQEIIYNRILDEAQNKADAIIAQANEYSAVTHAKADEYWDSIYQKARELVSEHRALRDMAESVNDESEPH